MKRTFSILALILIISACGGSSSKESNAKSDEQISTEIIESIDSQKDELSKKTNETLTEVDSLLQNL